MTIYNKYKHSNAFHLDKNNPHKEKFYTKNGWLSPYAMACGYIECMEIADNIRLTLERDSACYHVKASGRHIRIWESFDTLTQARQYFTKLRKEGIVL